MKEETNNTNPTGGQNLLQELEQLKSELQQQKKERENLEQQLEKLNADHQTIKNKTAELTNIFERLTDSFIGLDKDMRYTYVNNKTCEMIGRSKESLLGKKVWEEFPDAVGSETYHAFNKAMETQQYVNNIDYYEPLNLWQQNHIYPSPDGLSVFIRDISEQQKIKQKIEVEKDFSESIINSLPGIFYLHDKDGKMMRWNKNVEIISGYSHDEVSNMHSIDFFAEDEKEFLATRIGEVFTKGVSDAAANFYTKDKRKIPFYFTGNLIMLDEGPCLMGIGLNVAEKAKVEEELKSSYEHIRALATHLQDIREEERASMAREIHDELGQQLTGLKMDVAWIGRRLNNKDAEIEQKIKSTLQLVDETVKTVRRIASELRPSILDDLGLIAAIEWHSAEFEKRFEITTEFKTALTHITLPTAVATGLFRIYQESLTNVLRHANATKISSDIIVKEGSLILHIADNGKGFDIDKTSNKKTLGLLGMKERTLIMGGSYEIKSSPGKGTAITVTVPFNGG